MANSTEENSVSAIITAYNRPQYLQEALSSVLNQTKKPDQIIVVDDCSDMDLMSTLGLNTSERIIYHRSAECRGANHSRNTGLQYARGTYSAFLDDDDIWMPNYIDAKLAGIGGADLCLSGYTYIEKKTRHSINNALTVTGEDLRKGNNFCGTSGFFIRTDVGRTLLFDETLSRSQDWDFLVRALISGYRIANIPKPLFYYRINNNGGITRSYSNMSPGEIKANHIALIKHKDWLGKKAFNALLARRMLSFLSSRSNKWETIRATIGHVGLTATAGALAWNILANLRRR